MSTTRARSRARFPIAGCGRRVVQGHVGLNPQVFVLVLAASVAVPLGQTDVALARLFTPLAVPPGTYVVYSSAETIETLTSRLRTLDPSPAAPGRKASTTVRGWRACSTASASRSCAVP